MKWFHWMMAPVVIGAFCTAGAQADQLQQPISMASHEVDTFAYVDGQKDGIDIPVPGDEKTGTGQKDCGTCDPCGKDCGGKGCGCGGGLCITGDPVSIFDKLTPCRDGPLTVGGWVQAGFYNYNTGMFNNYPHNLNLNQMWLFAEKAMDTECGWDWGFRIDGVYGTDGPDTQAFGNPPNTYDFGWTYGNFYGTAIPQLYGEVGFKNLSVKVGHFYTICGYEVVTAPDNFFYSHAFTMYYAEPFTHTGVLATYETCNGVTVYGGWTKGWDTGFENFGGDVFLGGVSVGLGDYVTATYTTTFGNIGFGTDATGYSHSIVVDVALTERLNYVFQSDFVDYRGVVTDPRTGFPIGSPALSHRYGINNYLFYTINDCLAAGVRLEWFNVEQTMAFRSDLYEVTFGLKYQPHPNLILRPEIRWDQDNDAFSVDPGRNDTLGFGMDMILTF